MNARIGLLMGELGCTQGDVAAALGIHKSTLSNYLSGYRKVPGWVLLRLTLCERCAGLSTTAQPAPPPFLEGEMRRIKARTNRRMERITHRRIP